MIWTLLAIEILLPIVLVILFLALVLGVTYIIELIWGD